MNTQFAQPSMRTVFDLAWPMTIKAVMVFATVVIDTILVAPLGETALGAMALATAIGGFVLGSAHAFSNGLQIRTAQARGKDDPDFLSSTLWIGLALSMSVGVIGAILISLFGPMIVANMAQSDEMQRMATDYLTVFVIVILAESFGQALSSFFNGLGQTRQPMFSYLIAVPTNIVISIILIHGHFGLPALGVTGAACGSAIAVVTQATYLYWRLRRLRIGRPARWYGGSLGDAVKRHLRFVTPVAATFISAIAAADICVLLYAKLSLNDFAAMSIIGPWIQIGGTFGMQWAQASGISVAQMMGRNATAEQLNSFLKMAWVGAAIGAMIVAAIYGILCLLIERIYPELTTQTQTALLSFLPILLLLPFPKGSNAMCGNTLRAAGDTMAVMHIFIWSQWVFRVPATALFILVWDINVFWVLSIQLFEELLKFPMFHLRFLWSDWRTGRRFG